MLFGPMNAPVFYTCTMQDFHAEWDLVFILTIRNTTEIGGKPVCVTEANDIYVSNRKTYSGSRGILYNILAYSANLELILIYFEYIWKVFNKYRVSFKLDKCEFLKNRVELVGHYILDNGLCPSQSKSYMINDWTLTSTGQVIEWLYRLYQFLL